MLKCALAAVSFGAKSNYTQHLKQHTGPSPQSVYVSSCFCSTLCCCDGCSQRGRFTENRGGHHHETPTTPFTHHHVHWCIHRQHDWWCHQPRSFSPSSTHKYTQIHKTLHHHHCSGLLNSVCVLGLLSSSGLIWLWTFKWGHFVWCSGLRLGLQPLHLSDLRDIMCNIMDTIAETTRGLILYVQLYVTSTNLYATHQEAIWVVSNLLYVSC